MTCQDQRIAGDSLAVVEPSQPSEGQQQQPVQRSSPQVAHVLAGTTQPSEASAVGFGAMPCQDPNCKWALEPNVLEAITSKISNTKLVQSFVDRTCRVEPPKFGDLRRPAPYEHQCRGLCVNGAPLHARDLQHVVCQHLFDSCGPKGLKDDALFMLEARNAGDESVGEVFCLACEVGTCIMKLHLSPATLSFCC